MKSPYFPPVFLSFELFLVFVYLPTVPAATFMATSPPRITSLPYIFKARLRHRRHFANFNQATFSNFPSFLKSPATGSAAGYQRPDSDTDSVHGDVDRECAGRVLLGGVDLISTGRGSGRCQRRHAGRAQYRESDQQTKRQSQSCSDHGAS